MQIVLQAIGAKAILLSDQFMPHRVHHIFQLLSELQRTNTVKDFEILVRKKVEPSSTRAHIDVLTACKVAETSSRLELEGWKLLGPFLKNSGHVLSTFTWLFLSSRMLLN